MADTVKVEPTPIQRNAYDVALELTQLYFKTFSFDSVEDVQEVFTKFYATACVSKRTELTNTIAFKTLLPDNLQKIFF